MNTKEESARQVDRGHFFTLSLNRRDKELLKRGEKPTLIKSIYIDLDLGNSLPQETTWA